MFPLGKFLLLYGYDYRRINDKLTRFNVSWEKHSHVLHLGLDGYQRGKNASLQYNTTLYAGKVEPDSDMAETLATLGNTKGHFAKGTADITALQKLGRKYHAIFA